MPLAVQAKGKRKSGATKTNYKKNMFVMELTDKDQFFSLSTKSSQRHGRHSFKVRCLRVGMWVHNDTYINIIIPVYTQICTYICIKNIQHTYHTQL